MKASSKEEPPAVLLVISLLLVLLLRRSHSQVLRATPSSVLWLRTEGDHTHQALLLMAKRLGVTVREKKIRESKKIREKQIRESKASSAHRAQGAEALGIRIPMK